MKALSDCHVLVTSTSFGRYDPRLKKELEERVGKVSYNESGKPLSPAELVGLLPDNAFAAENHIRLLKLDELLAASDIVSLHVPVLPQTRAMVNDSFLARMKERSYLINTARGELVDEQALFEAITSGHLAGAALDAFAQEPPGAENALLRLLQVIATPHMGAHSDGAINAMGWMSLRNCLAVLEGEEAINRVV